MIKRALGIWGGQGRAKDDDAEDSDDQIDPKEQRKLERRLLPGVPGIKDASVNKGKRKRSEENEHDEEEDEDDDDDDEDGESEGGLGEGFDAASESDSEPPVPEAEEVQFRGQYRCQLCPNKILIGKSQMEHHLKSQYHKRNAERFAHAKAIGLQAYEEECRARAEAKEAAKNGPSKKERKNAKYWAAKGEKRRNKYSAEDRAKRLSEEQIEFRKQKFQAKKARRLARRQGTEIPVAEPADIASPPARRKAPSQAEGGTSQRADPRQPAAGGNRRQRRAAMFAAKAADAAG